MPWHTVIEERQLIRLEDTPDGKMQFALVVIIKEGHPAGWEGQIQKLVSKLGDILTAGRRRSWLLEGLYSKTSWGFVGWVLLGDLLQHGKRTTKEAIQHRVEHCPVWKHRGYWFEHPVKDYRYVFAHPVRP